MPLPFLILWGWYLLLKMSEKDYIKITLADRLQLASDSLMKEKKMAYFEPPASSILSFLLARTGGKRAVSKSSAWHQIKCYAGTGMYFRRFCQRLWW